MRKKTQTQNLWDIAETVLRRIFITIQVISESIKAQINNMILLFETPEKEKK